MISREPNQSCDKIAPLLVFYLCDELEPSERNAVESHLSKCTDCAEMASQERNFQEFITSTAPQEHELDSTHVLLSQCRSELAEKLDDLAVPRVKDKALSFVWMRRWMAMRPVWSGAFLVIFGLLLGAQSTQWFAGRSELASTDQAMNVRPQKGYTEDQLSKIVVAAINFAPSPNAGPQNLRLRMSAEEPVELTGSMDDSDVRQVVTYVVKNGERFEPGVRLDCLDALKSHAQDLQVRGALMAAARKDSNPAVRLKALDALRDSTNDRAVRETLLQALQQDGNPGVRVEAINLLVRSLEIMPTADIPDLSQGATAMARSNGIVPASAHDAGYDDSTASVIRALENLQHSDPNRYVRLRSASALRQINARNEQ
jgi:HEAT repeat protein